MKTLEERITILEETLFKATQVMSQQNDLITRLTGVVENMQQKNNKLLGMVVTIATTMRDQKLLQPTSAQASEMH